jgi:hypothetical protein
MPFVSLSKFKASDVKRGYGRKLVRRMLDYPYSIDGSHQVRFVIVALDDMTSDSETT